MTRVTAGCGICCRQESAGGGCCRETEGASDGLLFRKFASRLGFPMTPTHVPQAATAVTPQAAAARIAGMPDIITATCHSNISLVRDHILAQPSSVHQTDDLYDTASPNLFFISSIVHRKFVYFSFLTLTNSIFSQRSHSIKYLCPWR